MNDLDFESTPYFGPGFYRDISNSDYHRSVGVSSTRLKKLLTHTPAHIKAAGQHKPTDAQNIGSAVHALVLEPHLFDKTIAVLPKLDLRRPADREKKEQFIFDNVGKIILNPAQLTVAQNMAAAILKNKFCAALLSETINESSVFWLDSQYDDESPILMKARPDAISIPHLTLIDLKTATSASREEFNRAVLKYGYHISAYMYLRGVNQCAEILEMVGRPGYRFHNFIFMVVESEPPHLVACYELDEQWLELGGRHFAELVRRYRAAQDADFNSGYPDGVRELTPPPYAARLFDL